MENTVIYDPINSKPPGLSDKCWGKIRSRQLARRFFLKDEVQKDAGLFDLKVSEYINIKNEISFVRAGIFITIRTIEKLKERGVEDSEILSMISDYDKLIEIDSEDPWSSYDQKMREIEEEEIMKGSEKRCFFNLF